MATRRLLDTNPVLGISRYFHYHDNGTFTIETVQDVGGIVEANKRQFNDAEKRFGPGMWHHVGRIPLNLYYQYIQTGDDSDIKKFLNLSDNKAWLVKPVKI